jgi:N-(2-amino-2-carboxyethyl)-L-glutamate synthase
MATGSLLELVGGTPLVRLDKLFHHSGISVEAKCEFMNPTGSIKDRPARHIVERWLSEGRLHAGSRIVESTSGNFGVALALAARVHDLKFTAVVDPMATPAHVALMKQYGANVVLIDQVDSNGGYLNNRVEMVREICERDSSAVWINQYSNPLNSEAHFLGTGAEIVAQVNSPPDVLVVAVSTSGTIMGTGRRLKMAFPQVQVVAVDAVGSVIFAGPAGPRRLPGMGASRVPELLDARLIDQVVYVSDEEAITGCHQLLEAEGIMAGGSSGAVICAIRQLVPALKDGAKVVTLLPDRGERYLNLIYSAAARSPVLTQPLMFPQP